ncbi:hypothetical protein CG478_014935 [Bacillus cytotoxicus]|uniref:Genomic scaffold, Bacillus_thuringiensis_DB27_chromosome_scaffold07 n=2 Tax=Bacillus cytotoxicus TaxID=580165 RepID=A0AAX2CJ87_9BACI|nr:hypothetical protein CG483_014935 [Bacillus cytotoxicus]AWC34928.1 hypothetical protein CG482_014690 [Bacillus cytotoxicus]AWC38925.1 hypothetical protein CG481_014465 [Bacillus cytotoxicus]AWC43002.1 hypothetical protein CG480_014935 [Bacillus cytotoxicus]AWC46909.1 hypothetical protein CG479_013885 [Bacillus cytotoxicus]
MASGCIVGECPICEDWMFEDEWIFDKYDNIVHERCLHSKGKNNKMIIHLRKEIERLEKRIKELEEQNKSGQMSLF